MLEIHRTIVVAKWDQTHLAQYAVSDRVGLSASGCALLSPDRQGHASYLCASPPNSLGPRGGG